MVRSAPVRVLTLGHVAARIKAAAIDADDEKKKEKEELPKLAPGYMQLHGVWKPSLEAATYTVSATQKIKVSTNDTEFKLINNYLSTDTTKTVCPQVFTFLQIPSIPTTLLMAIKTKGGCYPISSSMTR
jgi:hypothetical protein